MALSRQLDWHWQANNGGVAGVAWREWCCVQQHFPRQQHHAMFLSTTQRKLKSISRPGPGILNEL